MGKRLVTALAVLLVTTGFVTGCGDDDDVAATTTSTTAATTTTTSTTVDDAGVHAGVVDGYCALKVELDGDDVVDDARLQDLLDTTPDEIRDEVEQYVAARRAGDFYASDALDQFADASCG